MNDLTTTSAPMTLAETVDLAQHFAKSGFFKDATDASKAVVKIVAGRELGIGPMTAMTGIHIVEGKPALSAGLVGALVLRSGRYTYSVVESTDTACRIAWQRDGRDIGTSAFTLDDAKRADVAGKQNWSRYPSDMLFARCLTRGARRFCPDVFLGAVYVAEELGDDSPHVAPTSEPPPAVTVSTNGNGRTNGNGHAAPSADVVDGHVVEVKPPAEFHATPLIAAMATPGELAGDDGIMARIQRGHHDNAFARTASWTGALVKAASLANDAADLGIVDDAYGKVRGKLTAEQKAAVQAAIDEARAIVDIVTGEGVPA